VLVLAEQDDNEEIYGSSSNKFLDECFCSLSGLETGFIDNPGNFLSDLVMKFMKLACT